MYEYDPNSQVPTISCCPHCPDTNDTNYTDTTAPTFKATPAPIEEPTTTNWTKPTSCDPWTQAQDTSCLWCWCGANGGEYCADLTESATSASVGSNVAYHSMMDYLTDDLGCQLEVVAASFAAFVCARWCNMCHGVRTRMMMESSTASPRNGCSSTTRIMWCPPSAAARTVPTPTTRTTPTLWRQA